VIAFRSGTSTGLPVSAASMYGPSPRPNCSSSSRSAVASLVASVSRTVLAVIKEIPAPSMSNPAAQAQQICSAMLRSSLASVARASNVRVTGPASATGADIPACRFVDHAVAAAGSIGSDGPRPT
jgi:hypothetical protein